MESKGALLKRNPKIPGILLTSVRGTTMKLHFKKILLALTIATISGYSLAGAVAPAPVEAPVMGPWALSLMAVLVAAIAYRVKKK